MDVVTGFLVVCAVVYAVRRGTRTASRAVKGAYRGRVDAWNSRHPATPAPFGVKVSKAAATGLSGGMLALRGFTAGWRQGWPEGKQRGREWWDRRTASREVHTGNDLPTQLVPHITAGTGTGTGLEEFPPYRLRPWTAQEEREDADSSERFANLPDITNTPNINQHAGGTAMPMPMVTNLGGEVHTLQQLVAELTRIIEEAGADLEDAQADRKRAQEDAASIEVTVASLQEMDLDQETLAEVGGLAEPVQQRCAAADQRATAAEAWQAQAQTALQGVQARHQLMAEAHAATPHAAEKRFYTE